MNTSVCQRAVSRRSEAQRSSARHTIAVADMKVGAAGDQLITHALGSCLGLIIFDPVERVGGLLHAMLPLSSINPEKAKLNPYMFVDTGAPRLFNEVYARGGHKRRLEVKAIGCGQPLGDNDLFNIGKRNFVVLEKLMHKNGITITASDVGGVASRTVFFDLATGRVTITSRSATREL